MKWKWSSPDGGDGRDGFLNLDVDQLLARGGLLTAFILPQNRRAWYLRLI